MRRQNILILYTDQQRWDALGASGNADIHTPNLDRLAAEGIHFDHYFVQNPVCMPSRLSFLTGQYPSTLGVTHMGVPVPQETVTLPRLLRSAGYVCGNIGKLHFLPHANRDHRNPHPDYGFDHLEISDEPGCYEDAYRAWVRRKDPSQLDVISPGLPPRAKDWRKAMGFKDEVAHPEVRQTPDHRVFEGTDDVTHTAFVAEQTMEFVHTHRERPWLCIAGFYSPHSPWIAPRRFLDLYDPDALSLPEYPPDVEAKRRSESLCLDSELRSIRHGYYAMVSEVDHHVGRILDHLEDLGLQDDTIIVFTSDHGEFLGEHLRYGKGYPGPDCVSRVPLIVRWPAGIARPGRKVSSLTEGVDVVPTLLDAAGLQIPPHLQGETLLPALQGRGEPTGKPALMEHQGWKSLRSERYRYICREDGRELLFDLNRDPGEYTNCAADAGYSGALADIRRQLVLRLLRAERPRERAWSY